jgi:uracil-DNA glycosylase family 4
VCLFRGTVPCEVLFIGEAPGQSEDTLGVPFVGPAGKLLEEIIEQGVDTKTMRYALCNVVGCIPLEKKRTSTMHTPDMADVEKCMPRLIEFMNLCRPKLIVCVGATAKDVMAQGYLHSPKLPRSVKKMTHINHPAYILRQSVAFQEMEVQDCVTKLVDACGEVFF